MEKLNEYNSNELLEKLNAGELSVLRMLGADKLKREMIPAGIFCKALAGYICMPKSDTRMKKRALKTLETLTPLKLDVPFPASRQSLVIGFNHPSLGEIFRLIKIAFVQYPDKEYLFPVNLPWYEAIAGIIPKLRRVGIHITPMITPSTETKLKAMFAGDDEKLDQVQHIKNVFERRYMRLARDAAEAGNLIFVAPSATRQTKVIGDHIHPTMTILAHMIYRRRDTGTMFLPVAIVEPERGNRGINLFKTYTISPCEPFARPQVEVLTYKSRQFDLLFLQRIDKERSRMYDTMTVTRHMP